MSALFPGMPVIDSTAEPDSHYHPGASKVQSRIELLLDGCLVHAARAFRLAVR